MGREEIRENCFPFYRSFRWYENINFCFAEKLGMMRLWVTKLISQSRVIKKTEQCYCSVFLTARD